MFPNRLGSRALEQSRRSLQLLPNRQPHHRQRRCHLPPPNHRKTKSQRLKTRVTRAKKKRRSLKNKTELDSAHKRTAPQLHGGSLSNQRAGSELGILIAGRNYYRFFKRVRGGLVVPVDSRITSSGRIGTIFGRDFSPRILFNRMRAASIPIWFSGWRTVVRLGL